MNFGPYTRGNKRHEMATPWRRTIQLPNGSMEAAMQHMQCVGGPRGAIIGAFRHTNGATSPPTHHMHSIADCHEVHHAVMRVAATMQISVWRTLWWPTPRNNSHGGRYVYHCVAYFVALGVAFRHAMHTVHGGRVALCITAHVVAPFMAECHEYPFVALHMVLLVVLHHGF